MITDEQIDEAFEVFLHAPELASWESDLTYPEHLAARRLFRERVRDLLNRDNGGMTYPVPTPTHPPTQDLYSLWVQPSITYRKG